MMQKFIIAMGLAAVFMVPTQAQVTAGSQISGLVQDPSGAAVPSAKVTVVNTDTAATRTVDSGADGSFTLPNLAVGPYRLQVTKDGFATYTQTGIVLQVNTNPSINVTMKLGSVAEQVNVEANAAMIETQNNTVGQVIDQARVVELPLNGRNVSQLIALSGAAVVNTSGGIATNLNYPGVAAFSVAGGNGNSTNYFLDGAIHLDPRTNVGLPLPMPDALQEFKVETSTLPANYGSQPGGAVNVITKSGTNAIHGNLFEFVRNGAFNARNYFAATRDNLRRNQFGGTIGGPAIKDKLFYFGGYQGTIQRTNPPTTVSFVPTADVMRGNFQTLLSRPCVANPVTLNAATTGAVNNMIPLSRLNPVAQRFLALIPVSTDPCGRLAYGIPQRSSEHQATAKVDWQRTARDTWFARTFITDYALDAFYDKTNLLTSGQPGLQQRVSSFIVGDTFLVTNSIVNSFRASLARSAVQRVNAQGVPTMTDLGSRVYSYIPNYAGQIQVNGYINYSSIPGYVYNNTYNLADDVSATMGRHQLAMGFNMSMLQMNALGPFQMNPRMTFTGQLAGNSLAGFMTGNMDSILQGGGQTGRDVQMKPSLYFQDNMKVSRRLQVNMGLRWDAFIPQRSLYKMASRFDPSAFYAGTRSKVFPNAPPGQFFPGDDGFPGTSNMAANYKTFAPRIGVVFDPKGDGRQTIRAAYGIFYGSTFLWNTLHVTLNPPWGNPITLNAPPGGLSDPWQGFAGGNPFPFAAPTASYVFPRTGTYRFQPLGSNPTYVQQWNLSFQKQIGSDWMASATYLGNKTTHAWLGYMANPAVFGPGATQANTDARRVLTLARPTTGGQLIGSMIQTDDGGNASYNGILLVLQRRLSKGISILANYTISHCLNQAETGQDISNFYQNPYNRRAEWGNCDSDRRHMFNSSLVANTPKFNSAWMNRVAGDWRWSGIFTVQSGQFMTITSGTDRSLTGVGNDRPDVAGEWRVEQNTLDRFFNTNAFALAPVGSYGNMGRNIIPGRANWNLDMALSRGFPIKGESIKADFRFEAFNVLNHSRFNNPGSALNAPATFGRTTTALDPRILQLALKLTF